MNFGLSYSAFAKTASNAGNSWATGTVSLTDDASGVAVFDNVSGLIPGSYGNNCILVTYTGSVPTRVKLYIRNNTGGLGPYLNLTIQTGNGPTCGAFGATTTLFTGTLLTLATSATGFTAGLPAASPWSPAANGSAKPYRFLYALTDDNNAQSATAGFDIVWEAQST